MLSPQHTAGKGIGEEPMPAAQAVSSEGTSKAPRAQGQGAAGGHEPPPIPHGNHQCIPLQPPSGGAVLRLFPPFPPQAKHSHGVQTIATFQKAPPVFETKLEVVSLFLLWLGKH